MNREAEIAAFLSHLEGVSVEMRDGPKIELSLPEASMLVVFAQLGATAAVQSVGGKEDPEAMQKMFEKLRARACGKCDTHTVAHFLMVVSTSITERIKDASGGAAP